MSGSNSDNGRNIGVGLIGYGMSGRVFHAPLIRSVAGLEIVLVATSRREEIAALDPKIRAVATPDEVFASADVELVVIASPSDSHFDLAKRALLAGKHVVVEKPVALTAAAAIELSNLAASLGLQLFPFHNRRWDSDFLSIQRIIASGMLGRVTHFESHFDRFRPVPRGRWREDGSPGSGVWFDLGPHLVDQAVALFGAPLAVTADIAALRTGGVSDDWAHVILHYDQLRVILHASLNSPDASAGGHPRFIVHGTKGTAIKPLLDPQEAQLIAGLRPGAPDWGIDRDDVVIFYSEGVPTRITAERGCQEQFYAYVETCLRSNPQPGQSDMRVTHSSDPEWMTVYNVLETARYSAEKRCTLGVQWPPVQSEVNRPGIAGGHFV